MGFKLNDDLYMKEVNRKFEKIRREWEKEQRRDKDEFADVRLSPQQVSYGEVMRRRNKAIQERKEIGQKKNEKEDIRLLSYEDLERKRIEFETADEEQSTQTTKSDPTPTQIPAKSTSPIQKTEQDLHRTAKQYFQGIKYTDDKPKMVVQLPKGLSLFTTKIQGKQAVVSMFFEGLDDLMVVVSLKNKVDIEDIRVLSTYDVNRTIK